jgi:hypothetical protein
VHALVRVNVPARDSSTTVGLFTHVPTSPLTNTRAENSCLLALFISYVERALRNVYEHVHAGIRDSSLKTMGYAPSAVVWHPLDSTMSQ